MPQSAKKVPRILIVEPNQLLNRPYDFISESYPITRISSIPRALTFLSKFTPNLVLLSASYPPSQTLIFLEALKDISPDSPIPLLMIIDLSHRLSYILGTRWGGKLAIIDHQVSKIEFQTTLERLRL